MQTNINPKDVGVPHEEWRPNQYEMYRRVLEHEGEYIFAELPTGSGKSSCATALGHNKRVLVVVHTLALLTQYEQNYNFSVVRGRQEYPCVLDEKVQSWKQKYDKFPTATDCHFMKMHECPVSEKCPYLIAKHKAIRSDRAACTYRYVGVSEIMKLRTGHIVFDEAHDAVEELIRFNQFSIDKKLFTQFILPLFPFNEYGDDNLGSVLSVIHKSKIMKWLDSCLKIFAKFNGDDAWSSRAKNLYHRFNRMIETLYSIEWFLQIRDDKIIFMALDAKMIAQSIFKYKETKLLMSATIGDPSSLAQSLGIEDYKFFTFDHPVPKTFRQVHDLRIPKMTKRNLEMNPHYYWLQVNEIVQWIKRFPNSWRGAILTTSYYKIDRIASYIQNFMPLRRYIIQSREEKISETVDRFISNQNPGDVMIGTIQGMGTGLDLYGNIARWIVIAGVPYPNPTDRYEKARREQFGGRKYQDWVTFNSVPQACGRVSRGETGETGGWIPNFAAIADGSATTNKAFKHYPKWFQDSIIRINK